MQKSERDKEILSFKKNLIEYLLNNVDLKDLY